MIYYLEEERGWGGNVVVYFSGNTVVWVHCLFETIGPTCHLCTQDVAGKSYALNKDVVITLPALLAVLSSLKDELQPSSASSKYVWLSRLIQSCLAAHIYLIYLNSRFYKDLLCWLKPGRPCEMGLNEGLTWEVFKWAQWFIRSNLFMCILCGDFTFALIVEFGFIMNKRAQVESALAVFAWG